MDGVACALSKLADSGTMRGAVSRTAIWSGWKRWDKCMEKNIMNINKGKCRVWHLGQNNPIQQDRVGVARKQLCRKRCEDSNSKFNSSQQRASAARMASCMLGCNSKGVAMGVGKHLFPSLALGQCPDAISSFWGFTGEERYWLTGASPVEGWDGLRLEQMMCYTKRRQERRVCSALRRGG